MWADHDRIAGQQCQHNFEHHGGNRVRRRGEGEDDTSWARNLNHLVGTVDDHIDVVAGAVLCSDASGAGEVLQNLVFGHSIPGLANCPLGKFLCPGCSRGSCCIHDALHSCRVVGGKRPCCPLRAFNHRSSPRHSGRVEGHLKHRLNH